MADMGMEKAAKREPEVNAAMAILDKAIADLTGRANMLVERTLPVRRFPDPTGNQEALAKLGISVSSVPLAAQLGEFRMRVNGIINQVNTALDQLEI